MIDPKFDRSAKRPWLRHWRRTAFMAAVLVVLAVGCLTLAWVFHRNAEDERYQRELEHRQLVTAVRVAQGRMTPMAPPDAGTHFRAYRLERIESRIEVLEGDVENLAREIDRRCPRRP